MHEIKERIANDHFPFLLVVTSVEVAVINTKEQWAWSQHT